MFADSYALSLEKRQRGVLNLLAKVISLDVPICVGELRYEGSCLRLKLYPSRYFNAYFAKKSTFKAMRPDDSCVTFFYELLELLIKQDKRLAKSKNDIFMTVIDHGICIDIIKALELRYESDKSISICFKLLDKVSGSGHQIPFVYLFFMWLFMKQGKLTELVAAKMTDIDRAQILAMTLPLFF